MSRAEQIAADALHRAETGQINANDVLILEAAARKGIPDAIPRENVLSYQAWRGKGRQVRKGQKALCSVRTFIKIRDKKTGQTKTVPRMVAVFHITQTDRIAAQRCAG